MDWGQGKKKAKTERDSKKQNEKSFFQKKDRLCPCKWEM